MATGPYTVIVTKQALKDFKKLYRSHASAIDKMFGELAENPHAGNNITPLVQMKSQFRYRVGKFRIFYDVDDLEIKVFIIDIENRGDAYKSKNR